MTSTTGGAFSAAKGSGWLSYAVVMLVLVGSFNIIDGIVALSRSAFYVDGARYVFGDLHTWGWIVLIIGILEVVAGLAVAGGSEIARWFGVGMASLNAVAQLSFLPAYPLWAIAAFTMDILVVYALVMYGGARAREAV